LPEDLHPFNPKARLKGGRHLPLPAFLLPHHQPGF